VVITWQCKHSVGALIEVSFLIYFLIQSVLVPIKSMFKREAQHTINKKIIMFCCLLGQANPYQENF